MPNLSTPRITALDARFPGTAATKIRDNILLAAWDDVADVLTFRDRDGDLIGVLKRDRATESWTSLNIDVRPSVSNLVVARVNRLLDGIGVPRFEWYHRTKTVVLRAPGRAIPLALAISASNGNVWSWRVSDHAGRTLLVGTSAGATSGAPVRTPVQRPITPAVPVKAEPPAPEQAPVVAPPVSDEDTPVVVAQSAPNHDPLGIFTFPTLSPQTAVRITPENRDKLRAAWKMHQAGKRQFVGLYGPTGTGKTSLVYDLAAALKVGVHQFDAAGASTFYDWVGGTAAVERNGASVTEWHPSALIEAVRIDGHYAGRPRIVIIDEITRSESAAATNFCMTLTNSVPSIYIPDARETIIVDPAVMIFFTGNIGSAYNAALPLDAALTNRVKGRIWLSYPERADEIDVLMTKGGATKEIATRLVDGAIQTRLMADRGEISTGVSTRQLIECADYISTTGLSPIAAAEFTFIDDYSQEGGTASERSKVREAVEARLRDSE